MGEHSHDHAHSDASAALPAALALTTGFAVVEAAAGFWSGSLALIGDAGHMVTDALALALATAAALLARRPPTPHHTYGLGRIEVLAALANSAFMGALMLGIVWTAVQRLLEPQPVRGEVVTLVALGGLAVNLAVAWILGRGRHDLNTRVALLHVIGDALGSVAALASGITIQLTGWLPADPLLSMFICVLIAASTWRLGREAVHTLLDGVPREISLPQVGQRMAGVPGVRSIHDLHIWSLSSEKIALSAHVVVERIEDWPVTLEALRGMLGQEFGIDHPTLQPEPPTPVPGKVIDASRLRRPIHH